MDSVLASASALLLSITIIPLRDTKRGNCCYLDRIYVNVNILPYHNYACTAPAPVPEPAPAPHCLLACLVVKRYANRSIGTFQPYLASNSNPGPLLYRSAPTTTPYSVSRSKQHPSIAHKSLHNVSILSHGYLYSWVFSLEIIKLCIRVPETLTTLQPQHLRMPAFRALPPLCSELETRVHSPPIKHSTDIAHRHCH
jgi:hypothetical protein